MPRLLSLLAARTSSLLNMAEVSRATGIAHSTLRRYLALLEALFIVQPLPAWSANLGKRLVKAPKLHLIDAGLAAHLQGHADPAALAVSPQLGPLLETFAVQELRRHLRCAETAATAWHFRTAAGREVDLVLEAPGSRIVGIEVKASASLDPERLQRLARTRRRGRKRLVSKAWFSTPASSSYHLRNGFGPCRWARCGHAEGALRGSADAGPM